jgi:hypothetical protein
MSHQVSRFTGKFICEKPAAVYMAAKKNELFFSDI